MTVGFVDLEFDKLVTAHPLVIDSEVPDTREHKIGSVSIINSTLIQPVTITNNTKLTESFFRGSTGLDQLRFQGDPKWQVGRWGRKMIYEESNQSESDTLPGELEVLYRQLRAGLEASKAAPAAADFFYGEMEARRAHTRHQGGSTRWGRIWSSPYMSSRWWLLSFYKWFAGYGVRAWRAFGSYLATVFVIGTLFFCFPMQLVDPKATTKSEIDTYWGALAFALRNSINLFRAPDTGLEPLGIMVLVLGRLAGVAFLALAVIGLRSHTER